MASKELILQIEALAKVNTSYESQLIELGKALTAAEAETKSATISLKRTTQGLEKSETHAGKLTIEVAQLKTKLSAEVQASATSKMHWGQKETDLNKTLGQLQKEHEATLKALKGTQQTLQQTQAEAGELRANLTTMRDKHGAAKAGLHESERLLGLETKSRESFQLAAEQAKRDYDLLQGSLPKQIQALNDAKSAAMAETASTKVALESANLTVLERENALRELRAAHQLLTNKASSDRLAAADEIAQLKLQVVQQNEQVAKLQATNAIGDRQLMLEARAKSRSDAEGSKVAQKASELSGRNTNLSAEVKQLRDALAAERDDHRRTSMALAEIKSGKEAAMYAVSCEQKKNGELTLKLGSESRRADDLQTRLKALTAQTSHGSSEDGGALSAVAAAAVQRAIKQQGRMSIASMRASARAETGGSPTRTPSPQRAPADAAVSSASPNRLPPAKFIAE
jgi:myosin heavy subunit